MDSADHFDKELLMNMTNLVDVLEETGNTILKVSFKTMIEEDKVMEKIKNINVEDLKTPKYLNALTKNLVEGESVTLTCYVKKVEPKLGRSKVIDLHAPKDNNIRYIDHRTINYIIYRNIKYTLSKAKKNTEDEIEEAKKSI